MTVYAVISAFIGVLTLFVCRHSRILQIAAAIFAIICCLFSWAALNNHIYTGTDIVHTFKTFENTSFPIILSLRESFFSCCLSLLIYGLTLFTVLLLPSFYKNEENIKVFYAKILLLSGTLSLAVLADNLATLFPTFLFTGLFTSILVRFYHNKPRVVQASFTVFIVNLAADSVLLLAAIGFLLYSYGNLQGINIFIAFCCLIAFLIKSGLAGFSIWVAETTEAPSLAASFICSAVLPVGALIMFYMMNHILALVLSEHSVINGIIRQAVLLFTVLGIFMGAFAACIQFKLKKILGYSSVSQTALILLGAYLSKDMFLPLSAVVLHTMSKTLLFTSYASVTLAASGEEDIRTIGGVGKILKFSAFYNFIGCILLILNCFLIASSCGLFWCTLICSVTAALTVIYTLRPFFRIFCGRLFGEDAVIARLAKEPFIVNFLCAFLFFFASVIAIKVFDSSKVTDRNIILLLANVCFIAFIYAAVCFGGNFYLSALLEKKYPELYNVAKEGFGSYKIYHRMAPLITRKIGNNISGKIGKTVILASKISESIKNKIMYIISLKNISDEKLYTTLFLSSVILIITSYFTLKGMNLK